MKKIVFSLVILTFLLTSFASAGDFSGKVIAVKDSDNISVVNGSSVATVRLNCAEIPASGQAFANEALQFLQNLILNKTVDVHVVWQDHDNRQVSQMSVDGQDVGCALAAAGFAWYDSKYQQDGQIAIAQAEAQGKKIGIWSQPNPVAPWDFEDARSGVVPNMSGPPTNIGGSGYSAPAANQLSDAGTSWDNNAQPLSSGPIYGGYYPSAFGGAYPRAAVNAQAARGAASRGGFRR